MHVGTLKEILNDIDDDNMEVHLAIQPNWALEFGVDDAVVVDTEKGKVLYISQGNQLGYLESEAVRELGWGEE